MQAVFLWDMLLQRRRSDGTPQCYVPEKIQGVAAKVRCLSESHGDGQPNSDQPHHEHAVLTVELIRVRGGRWRAFQSCGCYFVDRYPPVNSDDYSRQDRFPVIVGMLSATSARTVLLIIMPLRFSPSCPGSLLTAQKVRGSGRELRVLRLRASSFAVHSLQRNSSGTYADVSS